MSGSLKQDLADFARARILDVASELFFVNGYAQTKIEDITERLGVRKPFLYQYFASKADLLVAVSGRTTAFAAEMAARIADMDGTPSERLERLVRELALSVMAGRLYLGVLFREEKHLPAEARRALGENRKAFNSALARLLDEGVADGSFAIEDRRVTVEAITGMATWTFSWYRPEGRLEPDAVARQMSAMALDLVRAGRRDESVSAGPVRRSAG